MKQLALIACLITGLGMAQTLPTPVSIAVVLSPASTQFASLPSAEKPIFAPTLYVYVSIPNAVAGQIYVIAVSGATKNNGSFQMNGQSSLNSAWTVLSYQLQLGDSVTVAPTVSLYSAAGVAQAAALIQ